MVTVIGLLNAVVVVVAFCRAFMLYMFVCAGARPDGFPVALSTAVVASCFIWKSALFVAKFDGTEMDISPKLSAPPFDGVISLSAWDRIAAFPGHPSVIKKVSLLVATLPS